MDISGADAAEKLAILVRLFGRLLVDPSALPLEGIGGVEPDDIAAAAAFDGAIRPVAQASWHGRVDSRVRRPGVRRRRASARARQRRHQRHRHRPAARRGQGAAVLHRSRRRTRRHRRDAAGRRGGADDGAARAARRRRRRRRPRASVTRPHSAWFVRLDGAARESDVADLLGSYGIWTTRVARRGDRTYVLTCSASYARVQSALDALQAATGVHGRGLPRRRRSEDDRMLSVLKIGGSVLRDDASYAATARVPALIAWPNIPTSGSSSSSRRNTARPTSCSPRRKPSRRSPATTRSICSGPPASCRSVARLTLHLQRIGVSADSLQRPPDRSRGLPRARSRGRSHQRHDGAAAAPAGGARPRRASSSSRASSA